MSLTTAQLRRAMPTCPEKRALRMIDPLNLAMSRAAITDPLDVAAFLATVGHESLDLQFMAEIASGIRYEGRKDLGNTQPGDGQRFKGRGPIQVTGRDNYTQFAKWSGLDCVNHPELLEKPEHGFLASAWFWKTKGVSKKAVAGDFLGASIIINGKRSDGLPNGWTDRRARYDHIRKEFA